MMHQSRNKEKLHMTRRPELDIFQQETEMGQEEQFELVHLERKRARKDLSSCMMNRGVYKMAAVFLDREIIHHPTPWAGNSPGGAHPCRGRAGLEWWPCWLSCWRRRLRPAQQQLRLQRPVPPLKRLPGPPAELRDRLRSPGGTLRGRPKDPEKGGKQGNPCIMNRSRQ